jgi:hypothetical protein
MPLLDESEFRATFNAPMARTEADEPPPFDFCAYFESIPRADFCGHDCSAGRVECVYRDALGRFEHVLVNSEDRNVFMVLVLDRQGRKVVGHYLLDLPSLYGLAG